MREKLDKEYKEKKSNVEKIVEKFKTKGSLPKCERITVVADSEHMGEKVPFCADAKRKDGEPEPDKKSKKFVYNTVFPKVRRNFYIIFRNLKKFYVDILYLNI